MNATTNTTEALKDKATQLGYELIYDNGLVAIQPQQFDENGVRQVTTRPDPRDFKSEEAALTSLFEIQFEAIASEITSNGTNAASTAAVAACATEWAAYEQAVGTPEAQAAYSAYSAKWAQVTGNGPVTKEVR